VQARIPGFHDDWPNCGQNYPTGWAEAFCPQECQAMCRITCRDKYNPARCEAKCNEECMNECLFVPCCTRHSVCDDGWVREREECQSSYYSGFASSEWVQTDKKC
jgi:hypothetical protein